MSTECPVMSRIRSERGLATRVAEAVGVSRAAVHHWRRVPPQHVLAVSKLLGVPVIEVQSVQYVFAPATGEQHGETSRKHEHV